MPLCMISNSYFHPTQPPYNIEMHKHNGQYPVHAETCRSLETILNQSVLDTEVAGNEAAISLPNYTLALIPWL